jgi:hypothetical protein
MVALDYVYDQTYAGLVQGSSHGWQRSRVFEQLPDYPGERVDAVLL